MCLEENILTTISKVLLISSVALPSIYLLIIYIRKKKLMIGYYMLAFIIFLVVLFIRWGVLKIECEEKNNPVNVDIEETNNNTDNNNDNPNYVATTPKGYILEKIDGAYYIDDYLIVNKTYALDSNWVPKDTYYEIGNEELCIRCINKEAYEKWLEMRSDAQAISLNIYLASGYRAYSYQKGLYEKYVKQDGIDLADTYSARAGHSEHQSGLAFDLNTVDSSFDATNEGKWIKENAYLYGFIIRYPKGKTNETGYKYEPWHLRYVGKDLAKKLYNNGEWITMETYFGIDSKYD